MSEGSVGRPVGRVCRRVALGAARARTPRWQIRVPSKAARGHIYIAATVPSGALGVFDAILVFLEIFEIFEVFKVF